MEDAQDLQAVIVHAVDHDVGRAGNGQLTRLRHPSGFAHGGIHGQTFNGFQDPIDLFRGGRGIVEQNELIRFFQVDGRLFQPEYFQVCFPCRRAIRDLIFLTTAACSMNLALGESASLTASWIVRICHSWAATNSSMALAARNALLRSTSAGDLSQRLRRTEAAHLLVRMDVLNGFADRFDADTRERMDSFFRSEVDSVFVSRGYGLFKLRRSSS